MCVCVDGRDKETFARNNGPGGADLFEGEFGGEEVVVGVGGVLFFLKYVCVCVCVCE